MSVSLFDASFYAAANPDLAAAGITAAEELYEHFKIKGLEEGRLFSPLVDINFYRNSNGDLARVGLTTNTDLYEHLQRHGVDDNREFSPLIDIDYYLRQNPDVALATGGDREAALEHLQQRGLREKRQFSQLVDLNFYLVANPDLNQALAGNREQALQHLLLHGLGEGRQFLAGDMGLLAAASGVGQPLRFADVIGINDSEDYYKFRINTLSDVSLNLKGISLPARLRLIRDANNNGLPDEGGRVLAIAAEENNLEVIEAFGLTPGNYFIQVSNNEENEGDTAYELTGFVSKAEILESSSARLARPQAGNALSTALNLGFLHASQAVKDAITNNRPQHLYQFQLHTRSEVRLSLEGLSSDILIQVVQDINRNGIADAGEIVETIPAPTEPVDLNGNGTIDFDELAAWISGDTLEVPYPDAIVAPDLSPGNYFIQLSKVEEANGGETGYALHLDAVPIGAPTGGAANAEPVSWGSLGILGGSRLEINDFIGHGNPYDFYSLQIEDDSNVKIRLESANVDADLILIHDLDNNGGFGSNEIIVFPPQQRSQIQEIERFLGDGTYFVGVTKVRDNTPYILSVEEISDDLPDDSAGNDFSQATNIGIPNGRDINEFVGNDDPQDYYQFQVDSLSEVSLLLFDLTGNASLQLVRDSNGNGLLDGDETIAASEAKGARAEAIDRILLPGNYFVRVSQVQRDSSYTLWSNAVPISPPTVDAGNSLSAAFDLGNISGNSASLQTTPQTKSDILTLEDRHDFYKFSLTASSDLSIFLDNMSANADLRLVRDANANGLVEPEEILAVSGEGGATLEEITMNGLAPGNYYVWVSQTLGSTYYDLNIVANNFNRAYGHGLVDAKAAVASAIGSDPFPEVAPLGGTGWGLDLINAPEVWNQGYTGEGMVVAVVDSGVDYTHQDLDDNIWINSDEIPGNGIDDDNNGFVDDLTGWDFWEGDNDPRDLDPIDGHGTHVAGIIAGENNGIGVTGVAPNAKIMPVRVIGTFRGESEPIVAGIRYAVDNGANIINLSLGSSVLNEAQREAIRYATDRGVVVVMAAGNDGLTNFGGGKRFSPTRYPAGLASEVGLSVGAVDSSGAIAEFSNRANTAFLDYVVAPGEEVFSSLLVDTYQFWDGTSMAAPHVAGVAALIKEANPNLSPAAVEDIITGTANPNLVIETGEYNLLGR